MNTELLFHRLIFTGIEGVACVAIFDVWGIGPAAAAFALCFLGYIEGVTRP